MLGCVTCVMAQTTRESNVTDLPSQNCSSSGKLLDSDGVFVVPLTIDENKVYEGARELLKVIRPSWNNDFIKFKLFTNGITNKLVGCFYTNPAIKINGTIAENRPEDVVLVRVYGNKTDLLIDRRAETRNIKLLHRYGFAPTLFAEFKNGLAYEYVPGVTLSAESARDDRIWPLVARRMAEMHRVECSPEIPRVACLKPKCLQFLNLVPKKFAREDVDEKVKKLLDLDAVRKEFEYLYDHLERLDSPVVFGHNDLLLGNIIYTSTEDRVTFIDYEYADYNFLAFDIGNHFAEFAGIDEVDYSKYPDKEFQMKWLRVYLEKYNAHSGKSVTEDELDDLYKAVNKFALASHYMWAVWALVQAEHSTIDFDFAEFAAIRYNEYLARRDAFLSL